MTSRHIGAVIAEILEAIEGIETATSNKSLEDFSKDWLLRMGIQRALEIISQATRHIPDELLTIAPDIPWKQIRAIGNVLRHEYHKIADPVVWAVVTENIGPLRNAIALIQSHVTKRQ